MRRRAGAAHRAQEHRIDAFDHQRPIDHRQHQQRDGGVEGDHQQRLVVHRQDVAEQHMQQVDVGALDRDDRDAQRQRHQVEGRERGVFLQLGGARDHACEDRDGKARDQAASRHREQIEPGEQEADRRSRQDRMRHGVADEAHPPQHQEHADRRAAERQRDHGGERAAHELEFGEGRDQRVVDHAIRRPATARVATQAAALSSKASHIRRASADCPRVSTSRGRAPGDLLRAPAAASRENGCEPDRCRAAPPARCALRHASARPAPAGRRRSWRRSR